jgi:hypothetical protein
MMPRVLARAAVALVILLSVLAFDGRGEAGAPTTNTEHDPGPLRRRSLLAGAAAAAEADTEEEEGCGYGGLMAAQDQCAYVVERCGELASLVDYLALLYCDGTNGGGSPKPQRASHPGGQMTAAEVMQMDLLSDDDVNGFGGGAQGRRGARPGVAAGLGLWLLLLISLLGTTADYFFVPALEYLSFDMLNLSPEIAGITLLALVKQQGLSLHHRVRARSPHNLAAS